MIELEMDLKQETRLTRKTARLSLVDLAGSERLSDTNAEGVQLRVRPPALCHIPL